VIEARLDRNRGPMATILIQEGTLKVGDMVVAGRTFGKVRAMLDDRGNTLDEAGPSTPIEVLGLDGVPDAGDQVNAAEDDKVAKQVVEHRRQQERKRPAQTGHGHCFGHDVLPHMRLLFQVITYQAHQTVRDKTRDTYRWYKAWNLNGTALGAALGCDKRPRNLTTKLCRETKHPGTDIREAP
jgi:hypothetical protein